MRPLADSLRRYEGYPKMAISLEEFQRLPEYSCSVPTGVVLNKTWKRHDGALLKHALGVRP